MLGHDAQLPAITYNHFGTYIHMYHGSGNDFTDLRIYPPPSPSSRLGPRRGPPNQVTAGSPIASDTAHSPTTSRIASGSPRNRCDHCLDCEETVPARSQALAAGAIGSAPCAPASNPWILGTIVSAAAHSPTRCRIASATARNRRHVARIASSAARNPRLCSDCERAGSSRRRHQSPWERSCS